MELPRRPIFGWSFLEAWPGALLRGFLVKPRREGRWAIRAACAGRHNVLTPRLRGGIARQLEVPARRLPRAQPLSRRGFAASAAPGQAAASRGDDYGHHPTEIRATLAPPASAATAESTSSSSPTGTRARCDLLEEFSGAFADADTVIVLPIYAPARTHSA